MNTEQEIKKSIDLLTLLQLCIKNNVKQSFNDIAFSVEIVVRDLLNVLEKADYQNLNDIKPNYPAIDLLDQTQGIAVQVTTTADKKKVDKTIAMYEKKKMSYKELIILGFVSCTKTQFDKARVVDMQYLVNKIKSASHEKIVEVNNILQRELPINRLSPLRDKNCLEIVLSFLNRSAIRDRGHQEGCYTDMVTGLKEIKEVICAGTLKGKRYSSKSLYEYSEENQYKLESIEFEISKIIQIYNKEKNSSGTPLVILNGNQMAEIDTAKKAIIDMANNLAKDNNIDVTIRAN
ncbi:TPA: SMEK domain-containing protein [Vibrio parahaemolyticus]|nr:SMEK domain-containing protein [Vibrio parahaemolyticus]KON51904.1 hypothetical protein ACX02_20935 [Vibrio parahaemolyticus]KZW08520.1 hypothetical protein APF58_23375 [Vibrio parahaemolyticus]KZW08660.1 hypothetical protein APF57_22730 [Vibrio parahaemolyticus]KZW13145.1 hypothetical protein APF56_17440 [Vibrio parahaemolyticus]KZW20245.1 hypothetical protein APF60_10975 [Vibrio parahaemolyticus]